MLQTKEMCFLWFSMLHSILVILVKTYLLCHQSLFVVIIIEIHSHSLQPFVYKFD